MAKTKYLSLQGLQEYDELIKAKIAEDDAITLKSAKEYVDGLGLATSGHNHDDKYYGKTLGEELANIVSEVKSDVDAFFHDADTTQDVKDTLKEIQDYITSDAEAAEQMLLEIAGKASKEHKHVISDVNGLQDALDGKALAEHGTHVTYGAEAPKMDGTASAGTANSVSRSDHVHPTDTSRASKQEFDTHIASTNTAHITSEERTKWNAAKTHADSAHAPSDAEKNQNAFSNVVVGSTTIAANTATDTLTLVAGDNVTITPSGDSITISAVDTIITVDSALSETSKNPVENKAVYAKFDVVAGAILEHETRIGDLESKVGEGFEAITNAEIIALFETTQS